MIRPSERQVIRPEGARSAPNGTRFAVIDFPPGNQPPIITIASPSNNASFQQPAAISISANAFDAEGPVTNVEFFVGAVSLGADAAPPFSVIWSNGAVGSYSLTAVATDRDGLTATSSVVNVTITPPNL